MSFNGKKNNNFFAWVTISQYVLMTGNLGTGRWTKRMFKQLELIDDEIDAEL